MIEGKDYIYVDKTNIVGGLSSNEMIKGALFFTKRFIFVVPRSILECTGDKNKIHKADEFLKNMKERIPELLTEAFEAEMFSELPSDYVYQIENLETFKIWVGAGPFGNLYIKRRNEGKKAFNVHPISKRKELKAFFENRY